MTEIAHRTFRHGHRIGLAGAVVGIAALSGAGTVAGVLPALPTAHPRYAAVAETAVLPASSTTATVSSRRDRTDAAVPGAGPFPRAVSSAITAIFG